MSSTLSMIHSETCSSRSKSAPAKLSSFHSMSPCGERASQYDARWHALYTVIGFGWLLAVRQKSGTNPMSSGVSARIVNWNSKRRSPQNLAASGLIWGMSFAKQP